VGRIKSKANNKKELERCRKWKAIFGRITGADVSMSWIFSIIVKSKEKGRWRGNGRAREHKPLCRKENRMKQMRVVTGDGLHERERPFSF
jgi:hypothetical protein